MKNFFIKTWEKISEKLEDRFLILNIVCILVGAILIVTLFNLQIINGQEYRERSTKRLLREEEIEAPRGEIYDRNGILLATNKLSFDVDLYKTKVEDERLNTILLKLISILEKNGDSYVNELPIDNDNNFTIKDEDNLKKWKKDLKIAEDADVNQTLDDLIKKYKLESYDRNDAKKILGIRMEIVKKGYSLFKSIKIAKDVSDATVAQIEEIKTDLNGVSVISIPKRYYPMNEIGAHFLGYVSRIDSKEYDSLKGNGYTQNSIIGKMGIEQTYESYLKGENGTKRLQVDNFGNVASEYVSKEAKTGNNITLSIDSRLQQVAERSLLDAIEKTKTGEGLGKAFPDANAGAIVVLDVETSEVLAMASYPTFNINLFTGGIKQSDWNEINNNPVNPMFNRVISGIYSPGSTYKMLTGIAALESNNVTVDEKIQDTGVYPYGHKPTCWIYSYTKGAKTHGWVKMSEAIKYSCNVYFYEMGRRMGIETLQEYTRKFGLGEKTGIELHGEVTGSVAGPSETRKDWQFGETLSAAIGQSSNAFTPIQLANYIAMVANGGKRNQIHLVNNIEDNNGVEKAEDELKKYREKITEVETKIDNLNLKQEYIDVIKEGMRSVTSESGGTSYIVFKNSDMEVAGKTGTAQVSSGSDNGVFVGFAPYNNPKIAIVAIIEHGGEGYYTATAVKPVMEEYFKISDKEKENEKIEGVKNNEIRY